QPPRWIEAIFARVKQTDDIAIRVAQISLAPEPTLIYRFLRKVKAFRLQIRDLAIEVFAFKIDGCGGVRRFVSAQFYRKSRIAIRAEEAGIMVGSGNNRNQPEVTIKHEGSLYIRDAHRHLIESHLGFLLFSAVLSSQP